MTNQSTSVLVYDDDCGFCTWCAAWAARLGPFEPIGFANLTPDLIDRLPEGYHRCSHVLTAERVYSSGSSAEQVIVQTFPSLHWLFVVIRLIPGYERLRNRLYWMIANRRSWFGKLLNATAPIETESSSETEDTAE